MIDCDSSDTHRVVTHGGTHPGTVCRRDETNHTQAQALGPGLAVIAASMFSAGSHDSFLASCHRTVPGAANPPFEEASPPSSEESRWRELHRAAAEFLLRHLDTNLWFLLLLLDSAVVQQTQELGRPFHDNLAICLVAAIMGMISYYNSDCFIHLSSLPACS